MDEINYDYLTISYKEPLMYHRYKKAKILGAKEIQEILDADLKLSKGKPFLLLSDTRQQVEISPEGHESVRNDSRTSKVMANAVVVKWLGGRLAAKVFSEVNKPVHPFEVFDNEEEALTWLMDQHSKLQSTKKG